MKPEVMVKTQGLLPKNINLGFNLFSIAYGCDKFAGKQKHIVGVYFGTGIWTKTKVFSIKIILTLESQLTKITDMFSLRFLVYFCLTIGICVCNILVAYQCRSCSVLNNNMSEDAMHMPILFTLHSSKHYNECKLGQYLLCTKVCSCCYCSVTLILPSRGSSVLRQMSTK